MLVLEVVTRRLELIAMLLCKLSWLSGVVIIFIGQFHHYWSSSSNLFKFANIFVLHRFLEPSVSLILTVSLFCLICRCLG